MIYVSFVELFQQAHATLSDEWGAQTGIIVTVASFFAGILLIGIIDRLVPSFENPHEAHMVEEMDKQPRNPKLMRMGVMTALAIGIHNFPEGIAITSPKALPSRSLFTTPRATAKKPSNSRCCRGSRNLSGRCWPTLC